MARTASFSQLSARSDAYETSHAMQELDNELSAMTEAIRIARERRNALSLPSRLPTEILDRCFWFLTAVDKPDWYRGSTASSRLGWINVSHVCACWRRVSIGMPALWANVYCSLGSRWTTEMLSRAKATSLSLTTHGITQETKALLLALMQIHSSRIREIILTDDSSPQPISELQALIMALSSTPAPVLENLDLTAQYSPSFPATIFANHTPQLRRLSLAGMELPSKLFSVLQTVTDLSLEVPDAHVALLSSSGSTVWRVLLPSSVDFFTMLQTASSLRHLRLVHYFPDIAHGLTPEIKMAPVVLSHLEDFHLEGFGSNCVYVLQRVLCPSTKRIHIRASQTQTIGVSDTYLEPLFSSVTQLTKRPSALRIRSLFIRPQPIDGRRYMHVDAWEDSGLELTDSSTVRPWPRHLLSPTTFSLSVQYSSHRPSFTSIFCLLHLEDLRNLTIIIRPYGAMSKKLWKENIGPFRTLQHISVRGDTAISFFYALSETTRAAIESSGGAEANDLPSLTSNGTLPTEENIFLPNLTSIDIREVDFNESMDDSGTALLIALPRILMRRKAIGKPIMRLSILRCVLRRDAFHFLHNLVVILEWDNLEDGVQGEFDDFYE